MAPPQALRPRGSALALAVMRLLGWRLHFEGLPGAQGVVMVYPHTSNWDFPLGLLAKWAMGMDARFWGKDSLFKVPVFGAWMRWVGGVAINRRSPRGVVGDTVAQMRAAKDSGQTFWLVVAPEGTRAYVDGWRSGAYQVAVQAEVPVGLAYIDFATRTVGLTHFVQLSADPELDFAVFAQHLNDKRGKRPDQASPVKLKA